MKVKKGLMILFIGSFLFLNLVVTTDTPLMIRTSELLTVDNFPLIQSEYTPHEPINITHNDNFTTLGFPGDGSKENPYRIENLNISVDDGTCINIQGTSKYFNISNCELYSPNNVGIRFGIRLHTVTNGLIEFCTIKGLLRGVYMAYVHNISFSENTFRNCDYGIMIELSSRINFTTNDFHMNHRATLIQDVDSCFFINNTVRHNGDGLKLGISCDNWTIYDNLFGGNDIYQSTADGNNAFDMTGNIGNVWDDNVSKGNQWNNDTGTGSQIIVGGAGSTDRYPSSVSPMIFPEDDIPSLIEAYYSITGIRWWILGHNLEDYTITKDGGGWASGNILSYTRSIYCNLDLADLGTFEYTLTITNSSESSVTHTITTEIIDTTSPFIDHHSDIEYEGNTDVTINWTIFDYFFSSYSVFINASRIVYETPSSWTDIIEIDLTNDLVFANHSRVLPGKYNMTLMVTDTSSNIGLDSLWLTVTDTTKPTVSTPSDMMFEEGTSGMILAWSCSDFYPFQFSILENGTAIDSDTWDGTDVSLSLSDLTAGLYNYTILLEDHGGNFVSDSVWVNITKVLTTTTGFDISQETIMILGIGGGVIVLIIAVVVIRRR